MILDIVIPVYNEGKGIEPVLQYLKTVVKTSHRIYVCYDQDSDTTLPYLKPFQEENMAIQLLKNKGKGAHGAVLTGLHTSQSPYVLVFPADDTVNAGIIDLMVEKAQGGARIVCASRFMEGGSMVGCPWLKAALVRTANFTLRTFARLPTHDSTNGFRLFSRQVIDTIPIESTEGFTYSLELLVKCDRRGWKIEEVPAKWIERSEGKSKFRVFQWIPAYLRWYLYGFMNIFIRKPNDKS